ncbi:Sortilin [Thelohanellus kitauei]|uniref:Sortilin n=1 Tax=Thelohanellus kitauei TaxID=669202 RepID=A0A0C2IKT9_THEKT|nr:Sortilin [Thelohanellus kitauei]
MHKQYYIVVTNDKGQRCLFTSYDISSYFVRITCRLDTRISEDECPVAVHPHHPGIFFANIKEAEKQVETHISDTDGTSLYAMKLDNLKLGCFEFDCNVELTIPCLIKPKIHFPTESIILFKGSYYLSTKKHPHEFISDDGGKRWKLLPFVDFRTRVLNGGGILFGINPETSDIVYSFDMGNNWYHKNILNTELALAIVPYGEPGITFTNVVSLSQDKKWYGITHVDFSNLLSNFIFKLDRKCQESDFYLWFVDRSYGPCYQGHQVSYLRQNPYSLCLNNQSHRKTYKPCPCSFNDYRW